MADDPNIPAGNEDLFVQPTTKPVNVVQPLVTPVNTDPNVPAGEGDLFVRPNNPVQQSSSGLSEEPLPDWQAGMKRLLGEVGVGIKDFNSSMNYANVGLGTVAPETAKQQDDNLDALFQKPNEEDETNGSTFANIMNTMGDKLANMIPGLGAHGGGMAVGTAATGLAATNPASLAGGALILGVSAFGGQVKKSLSLHEDLPTARVAGVVSGAFNGALGMLGMGATAKGVTTIAAVGSQGFKQAAIETGVALGKASGINFLAQGGTAVIDAFTNYVASHMSAGATEYTTEMGLHDVGEAVKNALYTALPAAVGMHVVGHALKPIVGAPAQVKALTDYFNSRAAELHEKQVAAELKGHVDREVDNRAQDKKDMALAKETTAAVKLSAAHKDQADAANSPFASADLVDQLQGAVDKAKAKLAAAKAAVAAQPDAKAIAQEKARVLAEATHAKLKEEGYVEKIVNRAVASTAVLHGAAKDVLKAALKAEKEGRALTDNEKLALDRKVWLNKNSTEVRNEVLRGLQKLSVRALKQAGSIFPWSNTGGWTQVTHEGHLQIAFQYDPHGQTMARELSTEDAVNHYNARQQHYEDVLHEHLTAATGLNKGGLAKLAHKAAGDVLKIESKGADGEDHVFKLTADECMFYLSLMKNDKAKVALTNETFGNNFTINETSKAVDTTENAMRQALMRKDPNYINALHGFEGFYDDVRVAEKLKEDFERNNPGKTMPLEPKGTYGAQIVRRGMVLKTPTDLTPFMPGEEYTDGTHLDKGDPAQTKMRNTSSMYIEKAGAFERATQRTRQQAAYDAYYEPSKLWNAFINSGAKHNITVQFGDHLWNAIKGGYEDTVHSKIPNAIDSVVNKFLGMQAIHWFGLNPNMGAKHLTTIGLFAQTKYNGKFIPAGRITASFAETQTNWKKTSDFVMAQPAVRERYTKTEKLGAYTREDSPSTLDVGLQKGAMSALVWGDKQVVVAGYKAVYDWVRSEGGSEQTAHKEATRAFQHILASGEVHQQSIMSKNPLLQMMGFGQQPKRRTAQNVHEARRQAANFPTPENIGAAVRINAISNMSAFLFKMPDVAALTAVAAATGGAIAYQQKADEAWFQAFQDLRLGNMFSLGSAAVTAADTSLANISGAFDTKFHVWEPSLPYIKALGATYRFAESMNAHVLGGKEWTGNDILTTLLQAVQGPGALLPIPEKPVQAVKAVGDDILGN